MTLHVIWAPWRRDVILWRLQFNFRSQPDGDKWIWIYVQNWFDLLGQYVSYYNIFISSYRYLEHLNWKYN